MAKHVFQSVEIVDLTRQKVKVNAPVFKTGVPVSEVATEQTRLEALKREADIFRESWKAEKKQMIQRASEEAGSILKKAKETASETGRSNAEIADQSRQEAEINAEAVMDQAKEQSKRILLDAESERDKIFTENRTAAQDEGYENGWKDGRAEAERLIERLHGVVDAMIDKRKKVFVDVEIQIVDLVLLISRKVIKVISENQKEVVLRNIAQALTKLKNRAEVSIRVNLADLDISTRHIKDFLAMAEGVESIKVLEDSSIERGGAVIETDFGQIDARIHSQLREIEDKILELIPIKSTDEGWNGSR